MPHIVWCLHWNVNVTHSELISINLRQNIILAWNSLYVRRLIRAMIQLMLKSASLTGVTCRIAHPSGALSILPGATCRIAHPSGALSLLPVFSWFRVARSLVFCVVFCRSFFFILFLLGIELYRLFFFHLPFWYLKIVLAC